MTASSLRILLLGFAGALAIFASISVGFSNVACGPPDPSDPSDPSDDGNNEDNFLYCQTACDADEDCTQGYYCDEGAGVCGPLPCESDAGCNRELNGWDFTLCETTAECFDGYFCIDYGDHGGCAQGAVDGACAFGEELEDTERGTGDTVTVCGSAFQCEEDGSCQFAGETDDGCENDDECAALPEGYQSCVDGHCGCAGDDECTGDLTVCTSDGYCGCRDNSECTSPSYDTCVDGGCQCSAESCGEGLTCATAPDNVDDD